MAETLAVSAPVRSFPIALARSSARNFFWLLLLAAVAMIVVMPLVFVFDAASHQETRFGLSPAYSFKAFADVYSSPDYLHALMEALRLSACVTIASMTVGVSLAVLMARTQLPANVVPGFDGMQIELS